MDDATPTLSSRVKSKSRMGTVSKFGYASQANASQSAARCKAGSRGDMSRIQSLSKRDQGIRTPTDQDDAGCLLYFLLLHEDKTTWWQAVQEKGRWTANGRACRTPYALRALHHLRIRGARPAGRSGGAGARKIK